MKKIILVRHGKSSWEHDVIDHERPLKPRGIEDAHRVAQAFQKENMGIDLVLSSDAKRAAETCSIFVKILKINHSNVIFQHNLYDFSGELLTQAIKSCSDSVNSLMVFGHNHAFTAFVNTFGSEFIDNVPTSGLVVLELDINYWKDLKPGLTKLTIFPADLK
ncbi:SixA phosphatase family protein [Gaetbulibacter aestuarii]|uniref:Histidine phosphatase family protein n=1 Tax=Gaetbulibacter aestuarii TaxID=1502358 RepID=A0ABW7N353_9FLAO